jgi:CRP-like cAMP-binding protein
VRLQLPMSQTELGNYLSISRENVSRQLSRLRDANVITVNDQQIIISDEEGLAEIAATPSKE